MTASSRSGVSSCIAGSIWGRTGLFLVAAAIAVVLFGGCDLDTERFSPSTPTSIQPTSTLPPATKAAAATPGRATATTGPTVGASATGRVLPVSIAPVSPGIPGYDRSTWRHWIDEDGDCQNARQEVLIEESSVAVTFQSDEKCRVAAGRWEGPYTGTTLDDPGDLDVDHMVPLENAHRSGGWNWDADRKREYANYLGYENHLIATTAGANRSKGSKGPEEWRPPLEDYWCLYATDWVTIKNEWGLTVTEDEFIALSEMLATCETTVLLQPSQGTPPSPPTPTIPPSLPNDLRYDPFGPDRNCSDFDTYEEALAFFLAAGGPDEDRHRLDVNGDGMPCESLPGGPSAAAQENDRASADAPGEGQPSPGSGCLATDPPQSFDSARRNSAADCALPPGPAAAAIPIPSGPAQALVPTPTPTIPPAPLPTAAPSEPESRVDTRIQVGAPQADSTPVAVPESTPVSAGFVDLPFDPAGPDRNCDEFASWWDAQNFYLASGGPDLDPHLLDRNGDGTACQSLYGSAIEETGPPADGPVDSGSDAFEDRNCSDFSTWHEANAFFEAAGGPHVDPHRLDRNGDGVPCESLPGAPKAGSGGGQQDSSSRPTPAPQAEAREEESDFQDRNCSDFETWQEAQDFFISEGGPSLDPHRLDGDGNEIACQSLPGAPDG